MLPVRIGMAVYLGLVPAKTKGENDAIVSFENEPDDTELQICDRTCRKKLRVLLKSSSATGVNAQLDSVDSVLPNPSRPILDHRTSAAEVFTMFDNRTAYIINWLKNMRILMDKKKLRLLQHEIQNQKYEAKQEQRRTALEADREQHAAEGNNRKAVKVSTVNFIVVKIRSQNVIRELPKLTHHTVDGRQNASYSLREH